MSRKLTTYTRPSILQLLATTGTIDSLAKMRAEILASVASGEIAPRPRTLLAWNEAIWVRVLELMARQPAQAPYIYNLTLAWPKPDALARALEAQLRLVLAEAPTEKPAEVGA